MEISQFCRIFNATLVKIYGSNLIQCSTYITHVGSVCNVFVSGILHISRLPLVTMWQAWSLTLKTLSFKARKYTQCLGAEISKVTR